MPAIPAPTCGIQGPTIPVTPKGGTPCASTIDRIPTLTRIARHACAAYICVILTICDLNPFGTLPRASVMYSIPLTTTVKPILTHSTGKGCDIGRSGITHSGQTVANYFLLGKRNYPWDNFCG
jgi:hypothetical protein